MTQPKPVLCLGEALIDVVIRDDTRSEHIDGSPLNVACVITSLGRPALIGGPIWRRPASWCSRKTRTRSMRLSGKNSAANQAAAAIWPVAAAA